MEDGVSVVDSADSAIATESCKEPHPEGEIPDGLGDFPPHAWRKVGGEGVEAIKPKPFQGH